MRRVLILASMVCCFWAAFDTPTGMADDKQAQPEQLPAPKQVAPEYILPIDAPILRPCERTSRYDVWQYYGVDRTGHFRPRVIQSPYGAYYLYNGKPYPWTSTHALDVMPYVVD